MTDVLTITPAIVDGCARVIAGAIDGHIFAAGVTQSVLDAAPLVVPLADDFTEAGLPAVTCALGAWTSQHVGGNERLHLTILGVVWRPRLPLGDNVALLYADRDLISQAWIDHSKAFVTDVTIQSAMLEGGPGIVPRTVGPAEREFLTLPFTVNVVCNRVVTPQPA